MDIDENDILSTNKFVMQPTLSDTVPAEMNEEFRRYYENERDKADEKRLREKITLSAEIDEDNDNVNDLINTNRINSSVADLATIHRKTQEIKTYVSIDSRDRDKTLYTKPNHFKIFLGKTFYNVKRIKLSSVEFPNTNAVINSTNNRIYWRNQEDIDNDIVDNITKTYPIYEVDLRIGSYISTSLANEMVSKFGKIKRRNKIGDFHYFTVDLDIDTDIVTITSLVLSQVGNNPISVTSGLGIVTITAVNHGYTTGDTVYIVGAKTIASIPGTVLSTSHVVTVINTDTFQFEVNVKAGETAIGGGNTVKSGRLAPFQLMFGEYSDTLAPNIGFPQENSSQRIDTFIKKMDDFIQLKIIMKDPHNLENTFNVIGQTCIITGSGSTPNIDGTRVVTNILDTKTILVSNNVKLDFGADSTGQVTVSGKTLDIISITNYDTDTVLVETFTNHNYLPTDIGKTVTFYDTISVHTFNQDNTVYGVLSSTLLVIPGKLLAGGNVNVSVPGNAGSIPMYNPLLTKTKLITNLVPGNFTILTCPGHGLENGEKIKFYNVITSPSILNFNSGVHTVHAVLDSNTFSINFMTQSVVMEEITKENVYIGCTTVTLNFPYHGFNTISLITPCIDLVDTAYNVEITTKNPHGLVTGSKIRVMNTNTTPSVDGGGYVVKVIDLDTLRIIVPGGIGSSSGTSGIVGMSNNFYLYSATSVGGIAETEINGIKFDVKEVIDQHTFTFNSNSFASSTATGGGSNLFISSLKHGFNGVQTNTKNSLLNRSINLEGENYAFLCCPQLATMMNTGSVKDVFARITLDQSPGSMVFTFLSNPKEFNNVPLNSLNELEFSIVNYDNTLYEFSDLDYSFSLEITEIVDTTDSFNYSSRRGIGNSVN